MVTWRLTQIYLSRTRKHQDKEKKENGIMRMLRNEKVSLGPPESYTQSLFLSLFFQNYSQTSMVEIFVYQIKLPEMGLLHLLLSFDNFRGSSTR